MWGGRRNARGGGDGGVVRMLGFRAFYATSVELRVLAVSSHVLVY